MIWFSHRMIFMSHRIIPCWVDVAPQFVQHCWISYFLIWQHYQLLYFPCPIWQHHWLFQFDSIANYHTRDMKIIPENSLFRYYDIWFYVSWKAYHRTRKLDSTVCGNGTHVQKNRQTDRQTDRLTRKIGGIVIDMDAVILTSYSTTHPCVLVRSSRGLQ